jgi:hypothetical protein
MKDIAQIVQTKDDKPQNIDNIITEFSNIMVKTAEQLCPKRKCKKKRKREWTPDMTTIMKKGKFYHWKWKQEGNIDNRESANYKNMREQKNNYIINVLGFIIFCLYYLGYIFHIFF